MDRRTLGIVILYPLLLCVLAIAVATSIARRPSPAPALIPDASSQADKEAMRAPGDPKACVLGFLDARTKLGDMQMRLAGGEAYKPFLTGAFFTGWSSNFATLKDKEIIDLQQTGPDRWNVKAKVYRPNVKEPENLTFVIRKTGDKAEIAEIRQFCDTCDGTGKRNCDNCGGTGRVQQTVQDRNAYGYIVGSHMVSVACPHCGGKGKIPCERCGGQGYTTLAPDLAAEYDTDKNAVPAGAE